MNSMATDLKQTEHSFSHLSEIISSTELAPGIFRIRINNPDLAIRSMPGQFINIKISSTYPPLWRRPFSVHNVSMTEGWVEILFRVVGFGTDILSHLKPGQNLDILGPLGNHFVISNIYIHTGVLVAGGLGIAPFLFLSKELLKNKIQTLLFYGVRTESEFCCLKEFEQLGVKIYLSTEDGSAGHDGYVTNLVRDQIDKIADKRHCAIYACGPNPMLYALGEIANANRIKCQVSLETLMACGIGACLGCGVKANSKELTYRYVCKDGPVFNIDEIDLND